VLQAERVKATFDFEVVENIAGGHVLLPALAVDLVDFRVVAGQVGVFELAVEFEHAQGMAQLPVIAQFIAQARAQVLDFIVDKIVLPAVGGATADIRRAPVDAWNAAIRGAVVAVVFVLHQPVQVGGDLPAHRGCKQLAVTADVIAKAVFVFVAHVQAQADGVTRVGAEVGIQAA